MSVRVYVPSTLAALAGILADGVVPAGDERFVAVDETEEAEYAALLEAADVSAGLLEGPGRRVVIVAELDDPDAAVPLPLVRAVHADSEDVDPGDPDLPDLGWYAAQELADLLG